MVFDPYTERSARYETFIPGDSAHYHSSSACEEVKQHWISGADGAKEISRDSEHSVTGDSFESYIDDDEMYADHVEYVISYHAALISVDLTVARHRSSGVCDIILTGEVCGPISG